jgi:hypothetical protein
MSAKGSNPLDPDMPPVALAEFERQKSPTEAVAAQEQTAEIKNEDATAQSGQGVAEVEDRNMAAEDPLPSAAGSSSHDRTPSLSLLKRGKAYFKRVLSRDKTSKSGPVRQSRAIASHRVDKVVTYSGFSTLLMLDTDNCLR